MSGIETVLAYAATAATVASTTVALTQKPPKIDTPKAPTRDDARLEADQRSMMLKRRGRGATLLTSAQGDGSKASLGTPTLMGSG